MLDRATLAKIHIAKKELAMDDDSYRALLLRVGKVESAKDLTTSSAMRVLADLKRLGWKPKPAAKAGTRKLDDSDQSKMIRGLWLELHGLGYVRDSSEAALASFCKRQQGVDALQWLTTKQASNLIEELKKWRDRDGLKVASLQRSVASAHKSIVVDGVALYVHDADAGAYVLAPLEDLCVTLAGSKLATKGNVAKVIKWLDDRCHA